MKIGKFFKKATAIMLVLTMLLSILWISENEVAVQASDSPVKMYYCDHVINWRGSVQYIVYFQIDANSARNKAAYVHYSTSSGEWADAEATYVTHLDNNTEIWKATVSGFAVGDEYAIKYVGDGQIYWDNNNGNNYTPSDVLGQANIIVDRLQYQSAGSYTIRVIVKNLAYNKVVKVKYTQDNWVSYQEVTLNYISNYNNTNFEVWSVTLNLDENKMDSFQYCVCLEANGQTYWDNNFGANYDKSHYLPLGY